MLVKLKLILSIALTVLHSGNGQNRSFDGISLLSTIEDDVNSDVDLNRTWIRNVAATNIISPNKDSFYQGEIITFALVSQVGAVFFRNDYIRIVYANVTNDYHLAPYRTVHYLYQSGISDGATSVTVAIRCTWDVGSFKAVLFLESGTFVIGVSSVIEVKENNVNVSVSKASAYQGEFVNITFNSIQGVPNDNYDYYRIFHTNVTTNYQTAQYVGSEYVYKKTLLTERLTWQAGTYKVVFFLQGFSIVLGVSSVFEVKENNVNVSVSMASAYQGEFVNITFNSIQGSA